MAKSVNEPKEVEAEAINDLPPPTVKETRVRRFPRRKTMEVVVLPDFNFEYKEPFS